MSHPTSDDLRHLAEEIGGMLFEKHQTVATAESCTAGLVSATLTSVPAASDFFWGGTVVYADDAKVELAGLDPDLLKEHGTVSATTTKALAEAIRDQSMATYGIAVTGWAGPLTGPDGVIGRVFGAVADRHSVISQRWQFNGDRKAIRAAAVAAVLNLLRQQLAESEDGGGD